MATFKSQAIVSRTIKYGETSIIADLYTRERGMRSFIINGVRSKRGRSTASYYQLMTVIDIVAYDRNDGKLARLKEVKLAHHYSHLLYDVVRSSIGTFIMEVCRYCLVSDEQNTALYDFLRDQLILLDTTDASLANVPISFLIQLTEHLGFLPDNNYRAGRYFDLVEGQFLDEPISAHYTDTHTAHQIYQLSQYQPWDLSIGPDERRVLLHTMIDYYRLHIDHFKPLKSLPILQEIL